MKKLLLVSLALAVCAVTFGQNKTATELRNTPVKTQLNVLSDPYMQGDAEAVIPVRQKSTMGEVGIIETEYDLQTNASLGNRMTRFDDGTMAMVCTRGYGAYTDRGTGYNYYDGSSWGDMPTERIEDERTGWPCIAPWGVNGEVIVSHTGADILIHSRETKGEGEWTKLILDLPSSGDDLTWPRIVTSGENHSIVHVIAAFQDGGDPLFNNVYVTRSTDGLATFEEWSEPGNIWDEYNHAITADDYTMAAYGDNVAILFASSWYDLFYLYSDDNGENWEKTVIWECPYPQLDWSTFVMPTTDTLGTVDNSACIAMDQYGVVHVAFALTRVAQHTDPAPGDGSYSYWPWTDGIGYWNSSFDPIEIASDPMYTLTAGYLAEQGLLAGYGPFEEVINAGEADLQVYRELGFSCLPAISVDGSGVAITYVTAVTDNDGAYYFKRLFAVESNDGLTWQEPIDLTGSVLHAYDEVVYPVMPTFMPGDTWFVAANIDTQPGVVLDGDPQTEQTINTQTVFDFAKFNVSVNELEAENAIALSVTPNPVKNSATLRIDAENNVSVEIFSITGQKVVEMNNVDASFPVNVNVETLTSGVYFVTVRDGSAVATQKIIVE